MCTLAPHYHIEVCVGSSDWAWASCKLLLSRYAKKFLGWEVLLWLHTKEIHRFCFVCLHKPRTSSSVNIVLCCKLLAWWESVALTLCIRNRRESCCLMICLYKPKKPSSANTCFESPAFVPLSLFLPLLFMCYSTATLWMTGIFLQCINFETGPTA